MKSYNKKEKKQNTISLIFDEILLIFVIATISIILYDMYINIDVENYETYAKEEKIQEVSSENTSDISSVLEKSSKSVVRNIKN